MSSPINLDGAWKSCVGIIIQYYAPMTCDVVRDHTLYQKMNEGAELRFDYPALAKDFDELIDLGKTFGFENAIDNLIRVFALTKFRFDADRRGLSGRSVVIKCERNLCENLSYEIGLYHSRHLYCGPSIQRSKEDNESYPKVHSVLLRLGLMTSYNEYGLTEPVKKKDDEYSVAKLTKNQLTFSSSGTRRIPRRRCRRLEEPSTEPDES